MHAHLLAGTPEHLRLTRGKTQTREHRVISGVQLVLPVTSVFFVIIIFTVRGWIVSETTRTESTIYSIIFFHKKK